MSVGGGLRRKVLYLAVGLYEGYAALLQRSQAKGYCNLGTE